jgi:hypothetical protein
MLTWLPGEHVELGADLFFTYARGRTDFGKFPVTGSFAFRFRVYL